MHDTLLYGAFLVPYDTSSIRFQTVLRFLYDMPFPLQIHLLQSISMVTIDTSLKKYMFTANLKYGTF